jgi:hypothetical protein
MYILRNMEHEQHHTQHGQHPGHHHSPNKTTHELLVAVFIMAAIIVIFLIVIYYLYTLVQKYKKNKKTFVNPMSQELVACGSETCDRFSEACGALPNPNYIADKSKRPKSYDPKTPQEISACVPNFMLDNPACKEACDYNGEQCVGQWDGTAFVYGCHKMPWVNDENWNSQISLSNKLLTADDHQVAV